MANVKLTGIKHFEKQLLKLEKLADSKSPSSRIINAALRTGLSPMKKKFRANTKSAIKTDGDSKGNLINNKNFVIKNTKSKKLNQFGALLGFRGTGDDYGFFIEEGTKTKDGKERIEAKHPLGKAFDSTKSAVLKRTLDMLSKKLNKEFEKLSVK